MAVPSSRVSCCSTAGDLDAGLAVAVKDFVAKAASGVPVGEGDENSA